MTSYTQKYNNDPAFRNYCNRPENCDRPLIDLGREYYREFSECEAIPPRPAPVDWSQTMNNRALRLFYASFCENNTFMQLHAHDYFIFSRGAVTASCCKLHSGQYGVAVTCGGMMANAYVDTIFEVLTFICGVCEGFEPLRKVG